MRCVALRGAWDVGRCWDSPALAARMHGGAAVVYRTVSLGVAWAAVGTLLSVVVTGCLCSARGGQLGGSTPPAGGVEP